MPTTQWTKESILLDAKERNVRYVRLMSLILPEPQKRRSACLPIRKGLDNK